jgi:hypothetical protein
MFILDGFIFVEVKPGHIGFETAPDGILPCEDINALTPPAPLVKVGIAAQPLVPQATIIAALGGCQTIEKIVSTDGQRGETTDIESDEIRINSGVEPFLLVVKIKHDKKFGKGHFDRRQTTRYNGVQT